MIGFMSRNIQKRSKQVELRRRLRNISCGDHRDWPRTRSELMFAAVRTHRFVARRRSCRLPTLLSKLQSHQAGISTSPSLEDGGCGTTSRGEVRDGGLPMSNGNVAELAPWRFALETAQIECSASVHDTKHESKVLAHRGFKVCKFCHRSGDHSVCSIVHANRIP